MRFICPLSPSPSVIPTEELDFCALRVCTQITEEVFNMQFSLGKWAVLFLSLMLGWAGCSESPNDLNESDGGTKDGAGTVDGNSDADADTDTDTDTDGDTDGDTDADSEADNDPDSDSETDRFNDRFRDASPFDWDTDRQRDTDTNNDRVRPDGGTWDNEGDVELGEACTAGREDWAGICSDVASEDDCPSGASRRDDCAGDLICCINENECVTNQSGVCVATEGECAEGTENEARGCPTATPICCFPESDDNFNNN